MVYVFIADGFEEIETVTVVDLIRRAGKAAELVSVTKKMEVVGSRGICLTADRLVEDIDISTCEMAVLPGGLPGVVNLEVSKDLKKIILWLHVQSKWIAAICAAPTILEHWGVLGDRATVSESFVQELRPERLTRERVVVCDNVITSRAPGTAIEFTLEIISQLYGKELSEKLGKDILVKQ